MSTALVPVAAVGASLEVVEGTPSEVIERATAIANALMAVEKRQPGLVVNIQGRKYLKVEMWATMGAMLKVFPRVVSTARIDGEVEAWEATVELVHMSGMVVGRGDAMASAAERAPWARASFSIRSMAQTRATGKAFRLSFPWIPALAGYDATPAEEMSGDEPGHVEPRQASKRAPDARDAARRYLWAVFHALEEQLPGGFTRSDSEGAVTFLLTGKDPSHRAKLCSGLLGKEIGDVKDMTAEEMREAGRKALEVNAITLPDRRAA